MRVDDAIEAAVLKVVEPGAIAAAIAAEAEVSQQRDQVREALGRDLEAARYAADRAFRQYDAADPANRLVAGELETRWNKALARVAEVEAKIAGHDAVAPSRADSTAHLAPALAGDLRAVWTAPTTDARLKKRIVRTLIREVIADIDAEAAEIVLVIHWMGGVHTELRLPRRRKGQRNSTSPDIITAVRHLVLIANDDLIAGTLNRNGLVTGNGNRWTRERVTSLRSNTGSRSITPAEDGIEPWLNLSKAASASWHRAQNAYGWRPKRRDRSASIRSPMDLGYSAAAISSPVQRRKQSSARARTAKIPHGTASRSAKPILFNHIDRWVL